MRFINEYKYDRSDTVTALNAFNRYWKRKMVARYGSLVLAAVSVGLYIGTHLTRFLVFGIIFIIIFCIGFLQVALASKFDAARIAEETGVPDPTMRYELDEELRIYRNGKLHLTIPLEDIYGAKAIPGALAVFTMGNCTALFKDDAYLEGGATALRAYLREKGATIK